MAFAHPYFLLVLLLLPLLAWLKGQRGSPPAFLYSSVKLVEGLARARRSHAGNFLAALRWLVLAIFLVALAQPRLSKSTTEVKASGVDIVIALDMSGSMISEDFVVKGERVNRFNMARSVLKNFIDKRPNDRIGLVVFATQAYIATPLSLDHDFLQENLDRLEIGAIDQNSTAIGDGLGTAVNRLRDLKAKSKIVILATDGQNNSGKLDPLLAAEAAAAVTAAGATRDTPVLMLCRSGARSRAAAMALTALGFSRAYNIAGGFEGDPDGMGHRGHRNGWKADGLPWRQS